jgi:glycosyltransferase involved in cell wall biosynthesis
VHFVTGGFSGATQVAIDLCRAALLSGPFEPVLVLRRKRHTPMARVEALRAEGLQVHLVPGWAHVVTISALAALLRELQPQALLAHGFPEHLLGRRAGLKAGVPVLMQVEHNSRERYRWWSRWWARRLAASSAALVGVSEGVRQSLLNLGMPAEKTHAIPNGIDLDRFAAADAQPFTQRLVQILMSARFARQKDQPTLVRALALLRAQGLQPRLVLAGGGSSRAERVCRALAEQLGVGEQVDWAGHVPDLPERLMQTRIFVLSTHWEGMPLALVEAMAAGCACVASRVPGVEGVLEDGETGLLVPEADPEALAAVLARLLQDEALATRLGAAARVQALRAHGQALMLARYEALLAAVARRSQ